MQPGIRDACGLSKRRALLVSAAAVVAGALAVTGAAMAGALGLTITGGPSGTVASTSATFTFEAKVQATFECRLDHGAAADCSSGTITYDALSNGRHLFVVVATSSDPELVSDVQRQAWTVAAPPDTKITNGPAASTSNTSAVFTFVSLPPGGSFECRLDGSDFSSCLSPNSISGLGPGGHSFEVRAVDKINGADATPATAKWKVVVVPIGLDTRITSAPRKSTTSTSAAIGFVSVPGGGAFDCSLDGGTFVACGSPATYSNLGLGGHTFEVRAHSESTTDTTPAEVSWSVIQPVPDTEITGRPAPKVHVTTALVRFRSIPTGAGFDCSLDGNPFKPCASPTRLTRLDRGDHVFRVRAHNRSGVDASPAAARWMIAASRGHGWIAPAAGSAGGGAFLIVVGIGFVLRRRLRVRLQLQAKEEEPHGRCQGRAWQCQKELTLKPGPRTIAHLNASAVVVDGARLADKIEGQIVSDLNDAVDTYRGAPNANEELRLALLPVADALQGELNAWLAEEPAVSNEITLDAHLEGGKVECVLTPWRCRKGSWKKGRSWKVELSDERDEAVARVSHPGVTVASLAAFLSTFVAQVDVPEQRVPKAAPVPHT